jgi:sec-independent protein translocase protein TatB
VFGISLSEVVMIALVALIVVGPQKLPGMLRNLGQWVRKIRQMTTEVRAQTGIDDILRQEGIDGGIAELRNLIRGDLSALSRARHHEPEPAAEDPYADAYELDRTREYPAEGVDASGALPDDLVDDSARADEAATDDEPA